MNLKPGHELDIEVAKIIGWTDIKGIEGRKPNGEWWIVLDYSGSIAAAWEAWEWLEKYYLETKPKYAITLSRPGGAEALVCLEYGGEVYDIIAEGESYPHAICLAVLATKKEQPE